MVCKMVYAQMNTYWYLWNVKYKNAPFHISSVEVGWRSQKNRTRYSKCVQGIQSSLIIYSFGMFCLVGLQETRTIPLVPWASPTLGWCRTWCHPAILPAWLPGTADRSAPHRGTGQWSTRPGRNGHQILRYGGLGSFAFKETCSMMLCPVHFGNWKPVLRVFNHCIHLHTHQLCLFV